MKYSLFTLVLLVALFACVQTKTNKNEPPKQLNDSGILEMIELVLQEDTTQSLGVYNKLQNFSRENYIPEGYPDSMPPPPPPRNYISIREIQYHFRKHAKYDLKPLDSLHIGKQIDVKNSFKIDTIAARFKLLKKIYLDDSKDCDVTYVFYEPLLTADHSHAWLEYDKILKGQVGLRYRLILKSENKKWIKMKEYIRWES